MNDSVRNLIPIGLLITSFSQSWATSSIVVKIDKPYQYALHGQSTVVSFTGSIIVNDGYKLNPISAGYPYMHHSFEKLVVSFSSSLRDFIRNCVPDQDYQGELFTVKVEPTSMVGDYRYGGSHVEDLCPFMAGYKDEPWNEMSRDFFGVNVVNSVPEPILTVPVGLLVLALARKRKAQ